MPCALPLTQIGDFMHAIKLLPLLMLATVATVQAAEAPELSGVQLYRAFCSSCHGVSGHGDGPAAPAFKMAVPDLTKIAQRRGGKFNADEVTRIIDGRDLRTAHGSQDMPVWGWELYGINREDSARRERVQDLIGKMVAYLRSIQK